MRIGLDDSGCGEPVVLLHSSCYSRRQWRPLVKQLSGRYRTLALDLYGYGETDFPQHPETFTIEDEVALVGSLLDRVGNPVHLVGHSYGGAVALAAALQHPDRIRSLTLHEPVVFHLARLAGLTDVTEGIDRMAAELTEKVQAGLPAAAAQVFIDYWRGAGTWEKLPQKGQREAARVISKVLLELRAIFGTSYGFEEYGALQHPIYMTAGTTGRSAAQQVTKLLARVLVDGSLYFVSGVGHMAPITHPRLINTHIVAHLEQQAASS
mgnify:FL=1